MSSAGTQKKTAVVASNPKATAVTKSGPANTPGVEKNGPAKNGTITDASKAETIKVYELQMKNLKAHHVAKRVELRRIWVKNENAKDQVAKHWDSMSAAAQQEFMKRSVDSLVAEAIANHKQQKQATKEVSKTESLIRVCVADVVDGGKGSVGKKFGDKGGLGEILEMVVFAKENTEDRLKMSKMDEMMKILAEEEEGNQEDSEEEKELNQKLSLEIRSAYICEWASKVVRRLVGDEESTSAPSTDAKAKGKGKAK